MPWQDSPYLFPIFFSGSLTIAIGLIAWRRRRQAVTARSMAVLMLGASIWIFTNAGMMLVRTAETWQFWSWFNYLGIVLLPAAWLVYVIQMVGSEHLLTRKRIYLLTIEPILVLLAILTNDFHHLFYTGFTREFNGLFPIIRAEYGPFFWIHAAYSNVILALGFLLLLNSLIRRQSMYRAQYLTVMLGASVPWVSNMLFLFGLYPWGNLDLTPLMFAVSGLLFF